MRRLLRFFQFFYLTTFLAAFACDRAFAGLSQIPQVDFEGRTRLAPPESRSAFDPDIELVSFSLNSSGTPDFSEPVTPLFLGRGSFVARLEAPALTGFNNSVYVVTSLSATEPFVFTLSHQVVLGDVPGEYFIVADLPQLPSGIFLVHLAVPSLVGQVTDDEDFGALIFQDEGGGSVDIGNASDDPTADSRNPNSIGLQGEGGCKLLTIDRPFESSMNRGIYLIMILFVALFPSLRRSRR